MLKPVRVRLSLTVSQVVELRTALRLAEDLCRDRLYGSNDPDSYEWNDSRAFFDRLSAELDHAVTRGRGRMIEAQRKREAVMTRGSKLGGDHG